MSPGSVACALILLAVAAGCRQTTTYQYPSDLYNPNYIKRAKAVTRFAVEQDESQLPEAFRLLLDEESSLRLLAYETIRDLSGGEDFGYRPYLPLDVRIGIVTRWEAWWRKRGAEAAGGD
jgi:hypothetical protein